MSIPKNKHIKMLLFIFLLLLLAVPFIVRTKAFIFWRVSADARYLTETAEQIMAAGKVPEGLNYHNYDIRYYNDRNTVEFTTFAYGLVPSSVYQGFYYSQSNEPLGYHYNGKMHFIKDGAGWKWEEKNGDNRMYTEQITDHWYWFEMHY